MLSIRLLETSDLEAAERLSTDAGWNQTSADWRRFLQLAPDGCFAALRDGTVCGTVTTCAFGSVAWIGMMLVAPVARRQGVGTRLMLAALDHLERRAIRSVRLDATALGLPLYSQLGFAAQFNVIRFSGQPAYAIRTLPNPSADDDARQIAKLDELAVGYSRQGLLAALVSDRQGELFVDRSDTQVRGYALARPGRLATFLGPCIAADRSTGQDLLRQLLSVNTGGHVIVDVPVPNQDAIEIVREAGLTPVREFVRMYRGAACGERTEMLFASSGPEKG